jgi:hypothetical protein
LALNETAHAEAVEALKKNPLGRRPDKHREIIHPGLKT